MQAQAGSTIVIAGNGSASEIYVPDDDAPTWDVEVNLEAQQPLDWE